MGGWLIPQCTLWNIKFNIWWKMYYFEKFWRNRLNFVGNLFESRGNIKPWVKIKEDFIYWNLKKFSRCCYPAGKYMFKVHNKNTRTRCEICSKFKICSKILEEKIAQDDPHETFFCKTWQVSTICYTEISHRRDINYRRD